MAGLFCARLRLYVQLDLNQQKSRALDFQAARWGRRNVGRPNVRTFGRKQGVLWHSFHNVQQFPACKCLFYIYFFVFIGRLDAFERASLYRELRSVRICILCVYVQKYKILAEAP